MSCICNSSFVGMQVSSKSSIPVYIGRWSVGADAQCVAIISPLIWTRSRQTCVMESTQLTGTHYSLHQPQLLFQHMPPKLATFGFSLDSQLWLVALAPRRCIGDETQLKQALAMVRQWIQQSKTLPTEILPCV